MPKGVLRDARALSPTSYFAPVNLPSKYSDRRSVGLILTPNGDPLKVHGHHLLIMSCDQLKTLENDQGRVIHRKGRIAQHSEHFLAPPEGFADPPPPFNSCVPITVAPGVRKIYFAQRNDPNAGDLNDGNWFVARVDKKIRCSGSGRGSCSI